MHDSLFIPDNEGALSPEQHAFEELKKEIILGGLRPRERLLESEIASRFGIGRYLVRKVFDDLESIGLVRREANKGVHVRDYTAQEVEALYDMRSLLHEAAVKRMKLPADSGLISELKRLNDLYRKAFDSGQLGLAVDTNDLFHRTFFSYCGNPLLEETIEAFWVQSGAIHSYAIADLTLAYHSVAQHEEIIEAAQQDDPQRLIDACNDHLYPALEAYRRRNGLLTSHR